MDTEKVVIGESEAQTEGATAPMEEKTIEEPVQETPVYSAEEPSAAAETPAAEPFGAPPDPVTPPADGKAKKSFLRDCASWTDVFPIAAMLSVLLMLFGSLLSAVLDRWVVPANQIGMNLLGDADSVRFLLDYFEFYGIWIAFMLVILLFRDNWPMWRAYLYNGHGNNLRSIPIGILLGFGMNGFCILMSWIMGDIKLSYNGFSPIAFFVFLLCVMIQSGAEEIIDRCYLYQKLRRRYRWPVIAIVVNSLVFMALHMANPGVTKLGLLQVFLIGILFSLIIYFWDSLWTVIWAHTAWNFSQSIVFGLPNSGIVSKYSVFKLEAASARDGIFYNTGFGVEGSMGANAIIGGAIVIVLIYALVTKRGERKDHWAEMEARDAGKNHIWEAVVLTVIMAAILAGGIYVGKWFNDHAEEIQQHIEMQEALEEQSQTQEAQPQTQEAQPQTQEAQPQTQQAQPQTQEAQPQTEQAQPQTQEAQPQAQEVQPQTQEVQPQGQETQPAGN